MESPAAPQPSVAPTPKLLIQILDVGGQVELQAAPGLAPPAVVEILIKIMPFVWEQAKAQAAASAPVIHAPTNGLVQALKNRLRVNHGKVG